MREMYLLRRRRGCSLGMPHPVADLPMTFPVNDEQGPLSTSNRYPGTVSPDGSLAEAHFDEGLLVGYRWFDATQAQPLFAFGHGLTYSPMRIDHIEVVAWRREPRIKATVTNARIAARRRGASGLSGVSGCGRGTATALGGIPEDCTGRQREPQHRA